MVRTMSDTRQLLEMFGCQPHPELVQNWSKSTILRSQMFQIARDRFSISVLNLVIEQIIIS